MRTQAILLGLTFLVTALAGCSGGSDEPEQETEDPEPTKAPARNNPPADPEPEPFEPSEVLNVTMKYDVQQPAARAFSVPQGATSLEGGIDVMAREVCSTLQANADQQGPSVVFTGPNSTRHSFDLTPRSAACNTDDTPLESIPLDFAAVAGDWTVSIFGIGNVDVIVDLMATA